MGTTHPYTVRVYPPTPDEVLASCPRPGLEVRSDWSVRIDASRKKLDDYNTVQYEVGAQSIKLHGIGGDITFITIGVSNPTLKLALLVFKVTRPGISAGTWTFTGLGRRSIEFVGLIACNTKGY